MNFDQVPRPTLDPARRERILHAVLADDEPARRPRWLVPAAAAAAVVLLAVGIAVLSGERGGREPAPAGPGRTEPLDLGPLSPAGTRKAIDRCFDTVEAIADQIGATSSFDLDRSHYRVIWARRTDGPGGASGQVVAEHTSGHHFLCRTHGEIDVGPLKDGPPRLDSLPASADFQPVWGADWGSDAPDAARIEPDVDRPIVLTDARSPGVADLIDAGQHPELRQTYLYRLYRVSERVDRIEMRVGTADDPGVWRSAPAHDGYVFAAAWRLEQTPSKGPIWLETRAYDVDGEQLAGKPMGRERLRQ